MRCSQASVARHEPLAGSAPHCTRWLMIEIPRAWQPQPLDTEPLRGAIGERLAAAEKACDATILLVRRAGREPRDRDAQPTGPTSSTGRRWWAVDTTRRVQVTGTWSEAADLEAAVTALGEGLDAASEAAELGLLVCTHGTRDQCCAIDGRPLALALAQRWPEATWECTHLGGHRFAPTFLMLPDGFVYGRVPVGEGPDVVAAHLAGDLRADLLRGSALLAPPAQAAWARVARDNPGLDVSQIVVTAMTTVGMQSEVHLTVAGRGVVVTVEATAEDPRPLSCGDAPAKKSMTYAVTSLAPVEVTS